MDIQTADLFKALGVESRLKIIELLKKRSSIGAKEIAKELGITIAAASQHLKILKHIGLVNSRREGYWIPYSIDEKVLENCRCILNEVCTCGCHGRTGLKNRKMKKASLSSLRKYEKELEKKLEHVRKRISELKK